MYLRFVSVAVLSLMVFLGASCSSHFGGNSLRAQKLRSLGYAAVPLKMSGGSDSRFGVDVKVNGVKTRLLVDSGANATKISKSTAGQARIRPHRGASAISRGALGKPFRVSQGVGELSIGEMSVVPYLFSLGGVENRATAIGEFDGHIGSDGLQLLSALVDLPANALWLPTENARNVQDGRMLPLRAQSNLGIVSSRFQKAKRSTHFILPTIVRGRPITWVIDTGAEISLLSTRAARSIILPTKESNISILDANGDRAGVRLAKIPALKTGKFTAYEFTVGVTDLPSLGEFFTGPNGRPVDGILGIDFLRETGCLIDAKSQILYIGVPEQNQG